MSQAVVFSHAGDFVAAAGYPGEIFIWETQTGRLRSIIHVETPDSEHVTYLLAISPDDRFLLCGMAHEPAALRIYDVTTGDIAQTLAYGNPYEPHQPFFAAAFMQSGQRVITATLRGFRIFDVATEEVVSLLPYPERTGGVRTMRLSADEKMVLAAHEWAGTYLLDVTSGKTVGTFAGTPGYDTSGAALSPDNKLVAVCGADVLLYRAGAGRLVRRYDLPYSPWAAHFSPDGTKLLVYIQDGKIQGRTQIWQVEPHALLREWDEPLSWVAPGGIAWSPDGKYILIGGEHRETHERRVIMWSAESGELIRRFSFKQQLPG